jgi:hypothetical protein
VASLCHRGCAAKQQQAAAVVHLRRVREVGVVPLAAATRPRPGAVLVVAPGAGGKALTGWQQCSVWISRVWEGRLVSRVCV